MDPSQSRFKFSLVPHHINRSLIFAFSVAVASLFHIETSASGVAENIAVNNARKNLITPETLDRMEKLPGDLGPLPPVPVPADNPQSDAKIELGKMLFFDKRLSLDKSMSCATCHDPAKGYSDGLARSIGFGGKELGRHSPTVINIAYNGAQFWDGRAATMEEQAQGPIEAAGEMNLKREELVQRLSNVPDYKKRFLAVFGEGPSLPNVGKAIASFERTVVAQDSPFDRYMRGDKKALTEQEKKGLILFVGKAACSQCHAGPNFTDSSYHVLGVPQVGPEKEDLGRFSVTKDEKDKMAFKTPSLRNIDQTAPYMHNGAFGSLEEVVDFYNKGGASVPTKSSKILKLNLTKKDKEHLVAFLKSLTGKLPLVSMPDLPKDH